MKKDKGKAAKNVMAGAAAGAVVGGVAGGVTSVQGSGKKPVDGWEVHSGMFGELYVLFRLHSIFILHQLF